MLVFYLHTLLKRVKSTWILFIKNNYAIIIF